MLLLGRELLRKLDVKGEDEVSSPGRILGQRHSLSSHNFSVHRADVVTYRQIRNREMVINANDAQTQNISF